MTPCPRAQKRPLGNTTVETVDLPRQLTIMKSKLRNIIMARAAGCRCDHTGTSSNTTTVNCATMSMLRRNASQCAGVRIARYRAGARLPGLLEPGILPEQHRQHGVRRLRGNRRMLGTVNKNHDARRSHPAPAHLRFTCPESALCGAHVTRQAPEGQAMPLHFDFGWVRGTPKRCRQRQQLEHARCAGKRAHGGGNSLAMQVAMLRESRGNLSRGTTFTCDAVEREHLPALCIEGRTSDPGVVVRTGCILMAQGVTREPLAPWCRAYARRRGQGAGGLGDGCASPLYSASTPIGCGRSACDKVPRLRLPGYRLPRPPASRPKSRARHCHTGGE